MEFNDQIKKGLGSDNRTKIESSNRIIRKKSS